MQISLLHATYRAGAAAVEVRDAWLATAHRRELVEHVFACDADDEVSMAVPEIAAGVVSPTMDGVSAVRNWNAAAARATGGLLFVIADDLIPPAEWDRLLLDAIRDLDPARAAFVVKVNDRPNDDRELIRHPIVSRRYFERHGLWSPEFQGHYADDDFTLAAHRRGVVIDGRAMVLEHRHPAHGATATDSHVKMETSHRQGAIAYHEKWSAWERQTRRHLYVPPAGVRTISPLTRVRRVASARAAELRRVHPRRLVGRLVRRGLQALGR